MDECRCTCHDVWRSEGSLWESVLPFHHVGLGVKLRLSNSEASVCSTESSNKLLIENDFMRRQQDELTFYF